MTILYIAIGFVIILWAGFFGAVIFAGTMDWWYSRKNKLFIELQRDHSKPRRPAAK